jgi:valyl-tRNA synthetase
MIVFGLRFGGDVPFHTVFINGLVRDDKGQKMSKTRGNDVDPLELVTKHGADALRFTLAALAAPGVDPSLSLKRLEGYQAFVNKLWNASRFLLMNLGTPGSSAPGEYDPGDLPLPSRWILGRLDATAAVVNEALAAFRFDQAANRVYHFVWDEFCDWYVEISKTLLADPKHAPQARGVLLEVLETSLRLLHPFMPFVTEEIWQKLPHHGTSIMVAPYPDGRRREGTFAGDDLVMHELQALVTGIRTSRTLRQIDPKRRINVTIATANLGEKLQAEREWIRALARLDGMAIVRELPPEGVDSITEHVEAWEVRFEQDKRDAAAEIARLSKDKGKIAAELEGLRKRLDNPQFVSRAKPEVVAESQERLRELEAGLGKVDAKLRELGAPS